MFSASGSNPRLMDLNMPFHARRRGWEHSSILKCWNLNVQCAALKGVLVLVSFPSPPNGPSCLEGSALAQRLSQAVQAFLVASLPSLYYKEIPFYRRKSLTIEKHPLLYKDITYYMSYKEIPCKAPGRRRGLPPGWRRTPPADGAVLI